VKNSLSRFCGTRCQCQEGGEEFGGRMLTKGGEQGAGSYSVKVTVARRGERGTTQRHHRPTTVPQGIQAQGVYEREARQSGRGRTLQIRDTPSASLDVRITGGRVNGSGEKDLTVFAMGSHKGGPRRATRPGRMYFKERSIARLRSKKQVERIRISVKCTNKR